MNLKKYNDIVWEQARSAMKAGNTTANIRATTGISRPSLYIEYKRLGLPTPERTRTTRQPWSNFEDQLLGADTDKNLAKKLGRTYFSVWSRRRKLGIDRYKPLSAGVDSSQLGNDRPADNAANG